MDISIYFQPIDVSWFQFDEKRPRFGDTLVIYKDKAYFPEISDFDLAIIGVKESKGSKNNKGCKEAPDKIRNYFYELFPGDYNAKIVDLGDIIPGNTINDTYFALSSAVAELLENNVLPIILGGSQDLAFANYRAYENNGQIINIASIDSRFDLGNSEEKLSSSSYLSKIILHQPNYLFNYTNIGYQTYFTDQEAIELMNNLLFDIYRLGDIRANMRQVEPILRNADMLTFDVSAIRQPDAPGNVNASPNGFYGEESCQLCWYAGLSDRITSLGFYEVNPELDFNGQTSHLVSQMMWYFIEGFYHRRNEFPHENEKGFIKYKVQMDDFNEDLLFFKSKQSDRWWLQVVAPQNIQMKYERHYIVPCSHDDYKKASSNELPDKWWQAYKKLM